MSAAPQPVVLGDPVPYADGSEDELLAVMAGASDRSTGSDELARHIHDWPTRYHLSRMRANLLRPLRIERGMRVLDVGAGTGALARYLGEQGATVLALEGSTARAQVAATRCHDLPNVTVAVGQPHDVAEGDFDVVCCIGVLEYSGAAHGGARGPAALLEELRRFLAPDGVVALAIENQLGLKYLLGYPEDHLAQPWVGVAGYPGGPGVRTWSRLALRRLLADAGLREQRWLYPFPDYKLPAVVLEESAYLHEGGPALVDQLVGPPVLDHAHTTALTVDERRAHRSFLDAGVGPDVANSFLVVAAQQGADPSRVLPADAVAFVYGKERLRRWARQTVVRRRGATEGLAVETRSLDPVAAAAPAAGGWLSQSVPAGSRPWREGRTLDVLAADACAALDTDALAGVLRTWAAYCAGVEQPGPDDAAAHPFLVGGGRPVLPGDHLDVDLGNFVLGADGALDYVDREWSAPAAVDAALVKARALWNFAQSLRAGHVAHPWPDAAGTDGLALRLGEVAGVALDDDVLLRWKHAEAQLQHLVTGVEVEESLRHYGAAPEEASRPGGLARRLLRRVT